MIFDNEWMMEEDNGSRKMRNQSMGLWWSARGTRPDSTKTYLCKFLQKGRIGISRGQTGGRYVRTADSSNLVYKTHPGCLCAGVEMFPGKTWEVSVAPLIWTKRDDPLRLLLLLLLLNISLMSVLVLLPDNVTLEVYVNASLLSN